MLLGRVRDRQRLPGGNARPEFGPFGRGPSRPGRGALAQQDRIEAGNPRYTRRYRSRDYRDELRPYFSSVEEWGTTWERTLDWSTYERWLRSKSYVQALDDVEAFINAERTSLAEAFPDGRIVEPFSVTLRIARNS